MAVHSLIHHILIYICQICASVWWGWNPSSSSCYVSFWSIQSLYSLVFPLHLSISISISIKIQDTRFIHRIKLLRHFNSTYFKITRTPFVTQYQMLGMSLSHCARLLCYFVWSSCIFTIFVLWYLSFRIVLNICMQIHILILTKRSDTSKPVTQ